MRLAARRRGLALLLAARLVCSNSDLEKGLEFLQLNGARANVVTTESGLQYEVLESGPADGIRPNASSTCQVLWSGELLDGTSLGRSYDSGGDDITPDKMVKGWAEAMMMMRAGDKWKIFVPSELGYGDQGSKDKIPPGAVLVFEVKMLKVRPDDENYFAWAIDLAKERPLFCFVFCLFIASKIYNKFIGGSGGQGSIPLESVRSAEENKKVFMDIQIGDAEPAHVEFVLFAKHCPKTAENFRQLCTGEKGKGMYCKALAYKGSGFHRIIPGFMCQGGDFTRGDGTGGESIYGSYFDDEWTNGVINHSEAGLLSMANAGKNTNGSQFFILLKKASHLDGKHVVFGQVTSGMDVIREMEKVGSRSGSTSKKVTVVDCGEVEEGEKSKAS